MERVGSRLHGEINDAVSRFAELGREIALKHLEFLDSLGGNALVPLRVRRDQRNGNAVDQDVRPTFLTAIYLEIIGRIASGVITDIPNETWNQCDELYGIADCPRNLQGKVGHKAALHVRAKI